MENDSPNLFGSEPGPVVLAVSDFRGPADEQANDDAAAVEYHTDESADENVAEGDDDDGQQEGPAVDGSAEQRLPAEDKPKDAPKGLPPGRVKLIMKMDPDVSIVAADAVYLLTKATVGTVRTGNGATKSRTPGWGRTTNKYNLNTIPV